MVKQMPSDLILKERIEEMLKFLKNLFKKEKKESLLRKDMKIGDVKFTEIEKGIFARVERLEDSTFGVTIESDHEIPEEHAIAIARKIATGEIII